MSNTKLTPERRMLRRFSCKAATALAALLAPGGTVPAQELSELSLDGKTRVKLVVEPVTPATEPPAADEPRRGPPAVVAREILAYLRTVDECFYSDVLEAVTRAGYSPMAAAENLRLLVRLGLVEHEAKGTPYRLSEGV
jgi:hypothetical protein